MLLASIFPNFRGLGWTICTIILYCGITAGCSTAPLQEKLAEHFGQSNFSITGSFLTVDTLQFEDRRKVDQLGWIYCSIINDVFRGVCDMQILIVVRSASEMYAKVKKHNPVPATKVERPQLQASRIV